MPVKEVQVVVEEDGYVEIEHLPVKTGDRIRLREWIDAALHYLHVELLNLTPEIAIASTELPGLFHKDPCDRIIVATTRELDWVLATEDGLIREYPHVKLVDLL